MLEKDPDTFFERLKKNPLLKILYKLPAASFLYHGTLAFLGAVFYGFPSRGIKVIGITGTKGKTTTANLLYAILEASGRKAALLSSAEIALGGAREKNLKGNSMPGRFFIQHFLKRALKAGCEYAVIEVTSQGVELFRHRFIRFSAAGITNIAPEHIEAHGSFENYRAAKLAFLEYAAGQGAQVFINTDDEPSKFFSDNLPPANVNLYSGDNVHVPEAARQVLPGRFNLENIALADSVLRSFGITDAQIQKGLLEFKGVPGRAEFVQREPFAVVVDYAHTPESLKAIYKTVRESSSLLSARSSKLICVFGAAGGGRDKWKRPAMGKMAAEYCDEIILTDEDPYDEMPEEILEEIASGISQIANSKLQSVQKILDRKEAIRAAVGRAAPGDAVVITGKGSEPYIHLANGKVIEWSDRAVVEKILSSRDPANK